MNTMSKQGITYQQIMSGGIQTVYKVAAANQADLESTANVVSDIYNEMGDMFKKTGMSAQDASQLIGNSMTVALHHARISMEDFMTTMKYVGPQAAAMNVGIKDVSAAIALLGEHGIRSSQAGTTLRRMLTNLQPASKDAGHWMHQLGMLTKDNANIFYDAAGNMKPLAEVQQILYEKMHTLNPEMQQQAIKAIFGQYALSGMTAIVNTAPEKYQHLTEAMNNNNVMTDIMAEKSKGLGMEIQMLNAHWQTVQKTIGEALKPIVESLIGTLNHLMDMWQGLSEHTKQTIIVISGVTGVVLLLGGALLATVGTIGMFATSFSLGLETIGTMMKFMLLPGTKLLGLFKALSFAPVISGVKGLVSILGSGAGRLLSFSGIFSMLGRNIGKFADIVFNLHFIIPNALKAVSDGFGRLASYIVTSIPRMGAAFLRFSTLIYTSGPRILAAMIRAFSWSSIVSAVQVAATGIRTAMTFMMGPWGLLIAAVVGGVAFLITHWSQVTQWVKQHFGSEMPGTLNNLKTTFINVWNNIVSSVQKAWAYIEPTIVQGIQSVQKWWNSVWPQIYQVLDVTWKLCLAVLAPAIATIGTIIVAGIGFVKGAWQSGWQTVVSILKMAWDLCSDVVRTAWGIISGIIKVALDLLTGNFRQAGSDFVSTLKNAFSNITSLFSNLAQDAFKFGANFVKMLASGITGAVGAVTSAVSSVAGKIKSFLGFASPAKEGPAGPGSEMWGPNFVNMMAKGIKEHTPQIQAAVNGIALSMKTGVTAVNHNISQQNISIPSNRTNPNGGTNIYISIDGRSAKTDNDLAEIIAHKIYRQMPVVS